MVVCNKDRWVNRNKIDYPNHTTISVTEMVVCHRDRWVNRKITCNKINLNSYLSTLLIYRFTAENTPKRTSLLGFTILRREEKKCGFRASFGPKFSGPFLSNFGQHNPPFLCINLQKTSNFTRWKLLQKTKTES